MLLFLWLTDQSPDNISVPETKTPYLGSRNINVVITGEQALGAQETVTFIKDLQRAAPETVLHILRLLFQHGQYQIVFPERSDPVDPDLLCDLLEIIYGKSRQPCEGIPRLGNRFDFSIRTGRILLLRIISF
jgi:hypothetical protein